MAILGCNFDINFCQTLAPGSSLPNTSRAMLHVWNESSIIVDLMVKFIWKHNLPIRFYGTFKMFPGRLGFWYSKGKKWDHPWNSKTKSQRSEPNWLLKYIIAPNVCAKFQLNRLTTTFGPRNTFSNNDTYNENAAKQCTNTQWKYRKANLKYSRWSTLLCQEVHFFVQNNLYIAET